MTTVRLSPWHEPACRTSFASEREHLEYHWKQFIEEFPTEQDCVNELYGRIYGHSIKCPNCNSKQVKKLRNARIIVCRNCKKETYTLSGTFFHNIREAKRWLAAIWFIDHGIELNASSFARLVQVVHATADAIFKKLSFVVIAKMSDLPEISSREFISTFRKRSSITPAGEHPVAEQSEIEKQDIAEDTPSQETDALNSKPNPETDRLDEENSEETELENKLADRQKTVYAALSTKPAHFEEILQRSGLPTELLSGTLVMLELKGQVKRETGDWYSLLAPSATPSRPHVSTQSEQVRITVDSFVDFVHSTFNGISRKYIQNYLGWYWCIVDRKRWKPGELLNECSGFPKTSLKKILQYVSPLIVKFSLLPTN